MGRSIVLGPEDVGRRVVIRRMAGIRQERPVYTDLLGHLIDWSESEITVRTRTGIHAVPKNEIVRAKTVPDRRRPTATEAVELAAAAGWPAAESARLGDWLLRASDSWTMRGNTALPIGDPGMPRDEAIDRVIAWYRERGLPAAFSVPVPLLAGLDAELERRGFAARPETLVMTAPLSRLSLPAIGETVRVRLTRSPSPQWLAVAANRKNSLPPAAIKVLTSVPEVRFIEVYLVSQPTDGLAATARGVVADDERRWLGLSLIETAEPMRRRGLAQVAIGALARWAVSTGARDAYLQVEARNTGAVALYERIGFTVHHTYSTRVLS